MQLYSSGDRLESHSRFVQWILRTWLAKSSSASPTPAIGSQSAREVEQMAEAFEDIKDLQRYPLSCEKLQDGLFFHFSDGTSKFIPDSIAPLE